MDHRCTPFVLGDRQRATGGDVVVECLFSEHQPGHDGWKCVDGVDDGQPEQHLGVAEHVFDSVSRIGGVDGDERCAGLGHRPHREYGFDGPFDADGNRRLGPGAAANHGSGQLVRAPVQFGVGHGTAAGRERNAVGIGGRDVGENLWERSRGAPRGAEDRRKITALELRENLQTGQRLIRCRGELPEDDAHALGDLGDFAGGEVRRQVLHLQIQRVTFGRHHGNRIVRRVASVDAENVHSRDVGFGGQGCLVDGIRLEYRQGVEGTGGADCSGDVRQSDVVVVEQ